LHARCLGLFLQAHRFALTRLEPNGARVSVREITFKRISEVLAAGGYAPGSFTYADVNVQVFPVSRSGNAALGLGEVRMACWSCM
jgi:hypothetical protein